MERYSSYAGKSMGRAWEEHAYGRKKGEQMPNIPSPTNKTESKATEDNISLKSNQIMFEKDKRFQ